MAVTSCPLCHIPLVRSKSQGLPALEGRGFVQGVMHCGSPLGMSATPSLGSGIGGDPERWNCTCAFCSELGIVSTQALGPQMVLLSFPWLCLSSYSKGAEATSQVGRPGQSEPSYEREPWRPLHHTFIYSFTSHS